MSSYIMHICVSDIVKKKLNLTDKFVYGSVLPDNLKSITGDRRTTHYIQEVIIEGEKRRLPDIRRAIKELHIQDEEIKLGYIAHLVEDLIWFNDYIPRYARELEESKIQYLADNSIHTKEEFRETIYSDYINSNAYVVDKCGVDMEELVSNLKNIVNDEEQITLIIDNTKYLENTNINNNKFMTKESIDNYIEQCTNEVEKMVLELMGE